MCSLWGRRGWGESEPAATRTQLMPGAYARGHLCTPTPHVHAHRASRYVKINQAAPPQSLRGCEGALQGPTSCYAGSRGQAPLGVCPAIGGALERQSRPGGHSRDPHVRLHAHTLVARLATACFGARCAAAWQFWAPSVHDAWQTRGGTWDHGRADWRARRLAPPCRAVETTIKSAARAGWPPTSLQVCCARRRSAQRAHGSACVHGAQRRRTSQPYSGSGGAPGAVA